MVVRNRWNGKEYKLIESDDNSVTLERSDGTQFIIKRAEYYENYYEVKEDGKRG